MFEFFKGFIIVAGLFALCVVISYIISLLRDRAPKKQDKKRPTRTANGKIYYLTDYKPKKSRSNEPTKILVPAPDDDE